MTKTEHIQKLLAFIGTNLIGKQTKFIAPRPLPCEVHEALYKRMQCPSALRDSDVLEISFDPEHPRTISVFTALESHHNGSLYNEHSEEILVFDEFLDFAIDVLRNRVHSIVLAQIESEENQRKQLRAEARMKELGL